MPHTESEPLPSIGVTCPSQDFTPVPPPRHRTHARSTSDTTAYTYAQPRVYPHFSSQSTTPVPARNTSEMYPTLPPENTGTVYPNIPPDYYAPSAPPPEFCEREEDFAMRRVNQTECVPVANGHAEPPPAYSSLYLSQQTSTQRRPPPPMPPNQRRPSRELHHVASAPSFASFTTDGPASPPALPPTSSGLVISPGRRPPPPPPPTRQRPMSQTPPPPRTQNFMGPLNPIGEGARGAGKNSVSAIAAPPTPATPSTNGHERKSSQCHSRSGGLQREFLTDATVNESALPTLPFLNFRPQPLKTTNFLCLSNFPFLANSFTTLSESLQRAEKDLRRVHMDALRQREQDDMHLLGMYQKKHTKLEFQHEQDMVLLRLEGVKNTVLGVLRRGSRNDHGDDKTATVALHQETVRRLWLEAYVECARARRGAYAHVVAAEREVYQSVCNAELAALELQQADEYRLMETRHKEEMARLELEVKVLRKKDPKMFPTKEAYHAHVTTEVRRLAERHERESVMSRGPITKKKTQVALFHESRLAEARRFYEMRDLAIANGNLDA